MCEVDDDESGIESDDEGVDEADPLDRGTVDRKVEHRGHQVKGLDKEQSAMSANSGGLTHALDAKVEGAN